jgi:general secretion pathway protein J
MMRRQAGFTLLEVLAALAVFGLVLLGLGQGLQFGLQAWRGQARMLAWPEDMEALDHTLRLLVTRALGADESQPGGPIQGGPAQLLIVTRLARPEGGYPVPTEARLQVDAAHRLVLFLLPRPHVSWRVPPRIEERVLAEGVQRLELAYWKPEAGGGTWLLEWNDPAPPALVRIRLLFPPGDPRRWPDIVAAPSLGTISSSLLPFSSPNARRMTPIVRQILAVTVRRYAG